MTSAYGAPSKVKLLIHHQFPGIELVSPAYACDNATCHTSPDQRVDFGSTVQVVFNVDLTQCDPVGALMYELKNTKQFNKNASSLLDEATYIQLVMIWKVNNSREFCEVSDMIEHDKGRVWDRSGLMKLVKCYKLYDIQHVPIEKTYLMHDNTVLMTRVNATREEECYKLEITLSEVSINKYTRRLQYIDLGR
jgi:hypothetical protein